MKNIKNIIAVASGKGGVGKSTTAVNLALALKAQDARVGLLDADIHGPNQPQMMGDAQKITPKDGEKMQPLLRHGIVTMSIGYLIDPDTPIVWRGPMVSKALQQLVFDTDWPELDYLVIDLPPGTGDVQLTLAQKIPVSGAVVVTTPQTVALVDARKAIEMFNKVNISVLGLIENMQHYHCPSCGHEDAIFGEGGAEKLSNDTGVPLLGGLPLTRDIQQAVDVGVPTMVATPASDIANRYQHIALGMVGRLSLLAKNYEAEMPSVKVEEER